MGELHSLIGGAGTTLKSHGAIIPPLYLLPYCKKDKSLGGKLRKAVSI